VTYERRFEQDLPDLLEKLALGPTPDYRDDIVQRTARVRQRPAWTFLERWIPMATFTARTAALPPIPWRTIGLLALLILVLAAGALLLTGSPQRPLPKPFGLAANGLVVYSADGDIYTVDPVSTITRAVVTGPDQDLDPVWSLDGAHFAFQRKTTSGTQLYVARSDGRDLTLVTPEPLPLLTPTFVAYPSPLHAFSPDGRELLVAARCGPTWIAKTDGSGIRKLDGVLTDGEFDFRPPDGAQIAFVTCDESAVGVANSDGSGFRQLAGPKPPFRYGTPSWSPNGSLLAYHIWDPLAPQWTVRTRIVGADGTADRPLRAAPVGDFDGGPEWSNDGKRLVIGAGYADEIYAVVLSVNGSDAGVRSNTALVTSIQCCSAFEWAPDDAFVLVTPVGPGGPPARQTLLDPDTGVMRPASWTTSSQPSWQRLEP